MRNRHLVAAAVAVAAALPIVAGPARGADPLETLRAHLLAADLIAVATLGEARTAEVDGQPVTFHRLEIAETIKGEAASPADLMIQRAYIQSGRFRFEAAAGDEPQLAPGTEGVFFLTRIEGRDGSYGLVDGGAGLYEIRASAKGEKRADRTFLGRIVAGGVRLSDLTAQIRSELAPKPTAKPASPEGATPAAVDTPPPPMR